MAQDTESKARIQGVAAQIRTFPFLFGSMLGKCILKHTDNLSRMLQHVLMSARLLELSILGDPFDESL